MERDMGTLSQFCRGDLGAAYESLSSLLLADPSTADHLSEACMRRLSSSLRSRCRKRLQTKWRGGASREEENGKGCGPAGFSKCFRSGRAEYSGEREEVTRSPGSFPRQSLLVLGQAGPQIRSLEAPSLYFCHWASSTPK